MTIGQKLSNGLFSTQAIQVNVTVQRLASLSVLDNGNVSTTQNVTVTEKSISGTGLFGRNSVVLSYAGVANISIYSGQLADQYTVEASQPGQGFLSKITITDFSTTSFRATCTCTRSADSTCRYSMPNRYPWLRCTSTPYRRKP